MTRRELIAALASSTVLQGQKYQGMASRTAKVMPRGKPSGIPFHSRFTDIAAQAGLHAPAIFGGVESAAYILEVMGCGIAFIDYDNDGWLDIFVLCGTRVEGTPAGATNRLYKNNRDGTFTDVTEKAGLLRTGWAFGVTVADYNNDGFDDLFITYYGHNVLYRNNGDGTFSDVTKSAGLLEPGTRWSTGCTFVDYNRDGHVDLLVSHYLTFDFDKVPRAGANESCNFKGVPVNCGPRGLPKEKPTLYRNNGDGTFTNVTREAGLGTVEAGYELTTIAADFDNDGWPDLYIACDTTPGLYFRNKHDGTFAEEALYRGVALNEDGQEQSGMGLATGDYNLDGNLDLLRTHFADDTPGLYRNDTRGRFGDMATPAQLAVETRYVCWGAGMQDFDNDGYPDLFVVTGSVYPEVEKTIPSFPQRTPRFIFRSLGGTKFEELIEEAGPGISSPHCSRGCAFGDFDNDGDVDVVIMNVNEPPSLLRNDVDSGGHWIKIKLIGVQSNRSAIGARVLVRYGGKQQVQEVLAQSSYLSVNDPRLHFGLGAATIADLDIRWPNGLREALQGVEVDQLVTIEEGRGIVRRKKF